MPSLAALFPPAPGPTPPEKAGPTPEIEVLDEAAVARLDARMDAENGETDSKMLMLGAAAAGLLVLIAAGYGFYHRSSRYQPA